MCIVKIIFMRNHSNGCGTSAAACYFFSGGKVISTAIDLIYSHVCLKRSVGRRTKVQNQRRERMSTYISCEVAHRNSELIFWVHFLTSPHLQNRASGFRTGAAFQYNAAVFFIRDARNSAEHTNRSRVFQTTSTIPGRSHGEHVVQTLERCKLSSKFVIFSCYFDYRAAKCS